MIEFRGVKIFSDTRDEAAIAQIHELIDANIFDSNHIRLMSDYHKGQGCCIGFTSPISDKIVPNLVGVDIGCGMLTVNLHTDKVDFDKLDKVIRKNVPYGRDVGIQRKEAKDLISQLRCKGGLRQLDWLESSLGTLGGGNHFIEIDEDEVRNKYLIIHTGSRNLGKQVAEYYQDLAIKEYKVADTESLIRRLKEEGRDKDIQSELEKLKQQTPTLPLQLRYLQGKSMEDYLHDMQVCCSFADLNRQIIAHTICVGLRLSEKDQFTTRHNYISEDGYIRKGAIEAQRGQKVLIPLNMRDGCIIGTGKGNSDWNYSAPHGAGRRMSRSEAKRKLSLEKYQQSMQGIWSTTVNKDTIDEAPQAYKPAKEIIELVKDTIDIDKIITPCYNFKAAE